MLMVDPGDTLEIEERLSNSHSITVSNQVLKEVPNSVQDNERFWKNQAEGFFQNIGKVTLQSSNTGLKLKDIAPTPERQRLSQQREFGFNGIDSHERSPVGYPMGRFGGARYRQTLPSPLEEENRTYLVSSATSPYSNYNPLPFFNDHTGRMPYAMLLGQSTGMAKILPKPQMNKFPRNRWAPVLYHASPTVACSRLWDTQYNPRVVPAETQTCALSWAIYDSGKALVECGLNESVYDVEKSLRAKGREKMHVDFHTLVLTLSARLVNHRGI